METKTKRLSGWGFTLFILVNLLLCGVHSWAHTLHTQYVPLYGRTDGTGDTVTDAITLSPQQTLVIGTTYRVIVTYHMEPQRGGTLFCRRSHESDASTPVNYGCSPLEMTTTFTAQEERLSLQLQATIHPEDITDDKGQVLNIEDRQLCPTIRLTPLDDNQS